jgi:DNA-binding transcriptional ArsR family regulator
MAFPTRAASRRLQRFLSLSAREPTRSAMWALAHPVRYRIWELLREGPATASLLARRLGESRGSMSYHLRMLGRTGAIVEDEALGTRRERWWRRPEEPVIAPSPADVEGRAIIDRMTAVLLARDDDVRRSFVTADVSDEWQEGAFLGNWFVELTPKEADELGRRLFLIVDELRRDPPRSPDATKALVSISVLPVLG